MRALLLASVTLAFACAPPVPENPTYFQDVQPLVQANCARCHGPDPKEPQIAGFRLDRYVRGDDLTRDLWDYRRDVLRHAVELDAPPMPPDFALSRRQRDVLQRWVDQGAPKGTRANQAPRVELVPPAGGLPATADQSLDLTVRSWDEDDDGLWVSLLAREVGDTREWTLSPRFGQGQRRAVVDTGVLPSGRTFQLIAAADDGHGDDPAGNRTEVVLIGALPVDHGGRGAAPLVALEEPSFSFTAFGPVSILWSVSDADPADTVTVDLDLEQLTPGGTFTHVKSIAADLPDSTTFYEWTPDVPATDAGGNALRYVLRVTATDSQGNFRSVVSRRFSVAPPAQATTFTWNDVRQIFEHHCTACHGEPARFPSLEYFRLDKYDAADPESPANQDLGVREMRDAIYHRMLVDRSMPPPTREQPQADELARIRAWMLGGLPR